MTAATIAPAATVEARPGRPPAPAAPAAFQALYAGYYAQTWSWLTRRVADRGLAEDLTQATFVAIWDKIAAGRVDPTDVQAPCLWTRGWARMQLMAHLNTLPTRHEQATSPEALLFTRLLEAPGGNPAGAVADRLDVARLLDGVPVRARQVLALHFLDDLPLADVAAVLGLTEADAEALLAEGLRRARDLLGITPEEVAARETADRQADVRWRLKALAKAPLGRQPQLRLSVTAAIADGTYPVGTAMPSTSVLAARHAPVERPLHSGDASIAARVLRGLTRRGMLTGSRAAGYTVAPDGPRIAAEHVEPAPADQALARELLDGTWQPGELLPLNAVLGRRWQADPVITVRTVLDRFVVFGALVGTPGGRYYVAPLPGADFTPDPKAERPSRLSYEVVLAAVRAAVAETGQVPSAKEIKQTYRTGTDRAAQIHRVVAAEAGARQASSSVRGRRAMKAGD
jgi:RNA polymerase sigma factor (sigma-70 family)